MSDSQHRSRVGLVLRWIVFLGVPLSAWPLLAWLHAPSGPVEDLRAHGWQLARESAPVSLPDDWRRREGNRTEATYELRFQVADRPAEPWAVYLESLGMNAAVHLNGRLLGAGGRLTDPVGRNWARPLLFTFAPSSLRAGANELRIRVVSDDAHWGFLGNVYVGPASRLTAAYEYRHALKVTTVWIITACQVLVAMFTAALWIQWREESSYGWFTLATLAWAAAHVALLVTDPPVAGFAWNGLFLAVVGIWAALETRFLVAFLGDARRGIGRAALAIGGTGAAVVAVLAAVRSPHLFPAAYAWLTLLVLLSPLAVVMTLGELRRRGAEFATALPSVLGLSVVPCALHDWLVLSGLIGGGFDFYLPYVALPAVAGMSWALLWRFVAALGESEAAVRDLERRVREKHDELESSCRRLREVETMRVLADERERIMREMHDGLGSHLVSSLALVEGRAPREAVAEAIRGALEDLRLMVDALVPIEGDLLAALAMLRSRLGPRLEARGVRVQWSVEDLPPVADLGPHAVLQVLRILQEAITNVLKHAGARSVTIRSGHGASSAGAEGIFVEVADDGRGTAGDGSPRRDGRGLASMRRRASALGGELALDSTEGTTVRLWIPLRRSPT